MAGNFTMIKLGLAALAAAALGAATMAAALPSQAAAAATLPRHVVPAAAIAGELSGVACTSASACMAVGGRSSSPATNLAEKWNGSTWSAQTPPSPSGATGARLTAVACTSAKNCMAVGEYFTTGHTLPVADKWNGTKWSLVTVPAPSGATAAELEAVACTGATNCWASGANSDSTLIEHWTGSKWAIVSSPSPNPSKPNILSGIACPSASQCWAVGYTFPGDYTGSLTEKWNGSKWSVVSTPNSSSGELIGDGCSSTSACLAVGLSNSLFAIAQRWNGTKWSATTPAKPSGAGDSQLDGVSCTGATACESVGNYLNSSSSTLTLGEKWNGSKWAAQTMPAISGATYASLQGISCTSASNCWAAGESITSSGTTNPLLEKWNGSAWKVS